MDARQWLRSASEFWKERIYRFTNERFYLNRHRTLESFDKHKVGFRDSFSDRSGLGVRL